MTQFGHLEEVQKVEEDCSVSPVVITVKKDESVKTALGSRKLNYSGIKMRPHRYAEYGGITESNNYRNNKSTERAVMDIKDRS